VINKVTDTQLGDHLADLREFLLDTADSRRKQGSMAGKFNKQGKPNKTMRGAELEFYIGAYSSLTFIMSKLENTTHDEAMKYFSPAVMFAGMRDDSIVDELLRGRKENAELVQ